MQVILVHPRLRQARTLHIGRRTLAGLVLATMLALAAVSGLLSYVTLHHLPGGQLPIPESWLPRFGQERWRSNLVITAYSIQLFRKPISLVPP